MGWSAPVLLLLLLLPLLACFDPVWVHQAFASAPDTGAPPPPGASDEPADSGLADDSGLAADSASPPRMATNPILGGDRPDPHVLRTVEADGSARYWLVATPGSGADIPVWTSTDLVDWELATEG